MSDRIVEWAKELQSLAQAGLFYGRDVFDRERYQRIRDIAAEMMLLRADTPAEKIRDLFCGDVGYQTPKVDTRAAVIRDGKILLVQEADGNWALPGGWVDADLSVGENAVKEVWEEAGWRVRALRVAAVLDHNRHNYPPTLYEICSVFMLCEPISGHFEPNNETLNCGFFAPDALPPLVTGKTTEEQIAMCFRAWNDAHWQVVFD